MYSFASRGDTAGVRILLEHGILSFVGRPGDLVIETVKTYNDKEALRILPANPRVDVSSRNGNRLTRLIKAVINGYSGIVNILLEEPRLNPNIPAEDGNTALHEAALNHKFTILKALSRDERMDVNALDSLMRTPLHVACKHSMVEILLANGRVNPNARAQGEQTPLHLAARHGSREAVNLLLDDERVDTLFLDQHCETPLETAGVGLARKSIRFCGITSGLLLDLLCTCMYI
ncbi:ankyrin [Choiromyces venosus 120613-1]|uniref:Ankyrin n=1 Tax=Choiromyces venosus 120613-1 TaxID=1336337 RepID=A0A3N4JJI3_9PEZI|nr:ankyrin [Choiromyces venosus 120613-1]